MLDWNEMNTLHVVLNSVSNKRWGEILRYFAFELLLLIKVWILAGTY